MAEKQNAEWTDENGWGLGGANSGNGILIQLGCYYVTFGSGVKY